jgi:arsenate reductase
MKKIYYLKTCDTCKRILKQIPLDGFEIQEIKTHAMNTKQLEEMHALAGSYEALFSRRSKKYAAMGLKNKTLNEKDYKQLILEEYTFLKRPVILIDSNIFIGNTQKNVDALIAFLNAS